MQHKSVQKNTGAPLLFRSDGLNRMMRRYQMHDILCGRRDRDDGKAEIMMTEDTFKTDVKVGPDGQITLPKKIMAALGVGVSNAVTFIAENNSVRLVNTAVWAMQNFQAEMQGQAAEAGITSECDVMRLVKELRNK